MTVVRKALQLAFSCSILLSLLPTTGAAATSERQPTPAATSTELPLEGYVWFPQIAPQWPVVIIVSLPEQRAYVYRNGIRIGLSKVSTGKPGLETPTGVFEILEKRREHYSNIYNNAPMPFMQRLTWGGVALHAGQVPDQPTSHGCIRLPYAFSEALFAIWYRFSKLAHLAHTGTTPLRSLLPALPSPNPSAHPTRRLGCRDRLGRGFRRR